MQLSNPPLKLPIPFANSGGKNTIPEASQIGIVPGRASLTDGFPPLTRTPISGGGVPPAGLDMNGILYEISALARWGSAGAGYNYDSTFATAIGGYPKGARVCRADGEGYWLNTLDNNTTDPETSGAGWEPDYVSGITPITVAGANITLTPAQAGRPVLLLTGTLTANINLVVPTYKREWDVINNATGAFTVTVKTAAGTGIGIYAGTSLQVFGDGTNILPSGLASQMAFLQSGIGAGTRSVDSKLKEALSLGDWLITGTGDETTKLNAALAAAKLAGRAIAWNGLSVTVTANVPDMHLVTHIGPGQVTRGANTFKVSGTGTNALFVSTTGSATNDGLTAALPKQTIPQILAVIANYGPVVTQKFNISGTAGTYSAITPISYTTATIQTVDFSGPSVGGSPNVPTLIIDGGSGAGAQYSHGIFAQGDGVRLRVNDVKFINFNTGGGSGLDRTRGGIVFDQGAFGHCVNVHVTASSWFGAYGTSAKLMLIEGGIYDGCRQNINTDNSRVSVGWNGGPSSNRVLIKNATENGVAWSNGTQGHVDYTDFNDNAIGLHMEGGSRCDAVDLNFKRNTVAVNLLAGGFFGDNPNLPCNFNVNTVDANTTNIKTYAGGADYNGLLKNAVSQARVDQMRNDVTITGTTADTQYYLSSTAIPPGFFRDATQNIKIFVWGVVTTAALPATLKANIAGVALANMQMPANAIAGQPFKLEIEMMSNGPGNHLVYQNLTAGTATVDRKSLGIVTFNFVSGSTIQLLGTLQNAADTLLIRRVEVHAAG